MKKNEKIFLFILILIMIVNTIFNYRKEGTKSIIELSIGVFLYVLPIINNNILKFKITRTIRYIYYILVFLVYYLCVFLNIKEIMNYHALICLISGLLLIFLSLIIINKLFKLKNKSYILDILFIFLISIIISIVLQLIISLINNYDIVQFFKSVLIMLTGTSIGCLWYLYESVTKTKLFITKFIEEIRDNYG